MLSPGTDAQHWSAGKHVVSRSEHAYPRPLGVFPILQTFWRPREGMPPYGFSDSL
jgi:hypothetical protein